LSIDRGRITGATYHNARLTGNIPIRFHKQTLYNAGLSERALRERLIQNLLNFNDLQIIAVL
jgi:hypothetical protein